ncbi:MAG: hypothetical protein LAP85_28105 [Acidobacteriia bacterium]|nr:hypothetical protein [Terriglobia bacterium]
MKQKLTPVKSKKIGRGQTQAGAFAVLLARQKFPHADQDRRVGVGQRFSASKPAFASHIHE